MRFLIDFTYDPHMVAWTMLFTCEFHNKILFFGHSEVVGFWPYLLAFKAAVPEILLCKELDFFLESLIYV